MIEYVLHSTFYILLQVLYHIITSFISYYSITSHYTVHTPFVVSPFLFYCWEWVVVTVGTLVAPSLQVTAKEAIQSIESRTVLSGSGYIQYCILFDIIMVKHRYICILSKNAVRC